MTAPKIILHVPHSSAEIPADVRAQFLLDDDDLAAELRHMTDWYTDELFALPPDEAFTVRFPVSRLVVDPERFEDPKDEQMEAVGMGAVYAKTSHGADRLLIPCPPSAARRVPQHGGVLEPAAGSR